MGSQPTSRLTHICGLRKLDNQPVFLSGSVISGVCHSVQGERQGELIRPLGYQRPPIQHAKQSSQTTVTTGANRHN